MLRGLASIHLSICPSVNFFTSGYLLLQFTSVPKGELIHKYMLRSSDNCAQCSHKAVAMLYHFCNVTSYITLLCYIYTFCIKVRT